MVRHSSRWFPWTVLLASFVSGLRPEKLQHVASTNSSFDYVVVGGGTAGLVVASRLSENPQVSVAVIEAGNFEKDNFNVTTTTQIGLGRGTSIDWQYLSVPQIYANNQSMLWSAGKGLGGSSLINGMTYLRPSSSQMDLWPSVGLEIDWDILFNYSARGEQYQIPSQALIDLGAGYEPLAHGYDGPVKTCISPNISTSNLHDILNSTFQALGTPPRSEFNDGDLRGFGYQSATIDRQLGIRDDAARAYYYPFADRDNLVVMVNTTGTRILWSNNCASREAIATAIEVIDQHGKTSQVRANKEIILSAGAIRSPAILEHSGVGNPAVLARQSIDVKVDLPAVGENFQDQSVLIMSASLKQNYTGFPAFVAHTSLQDLFGASTQSLYDSTLAKLSEYAATIAAQNGGASSIAVQEHLLRTQLDLLLTSNTPASEIAPGVYGDLLGAVYWPLQPLSRGSIHINSTNATVPPVIDGKFFQLDFDVQLAVATSKFIRKLYTTPPVADIIDLGTLNPGFDMLPANATDEQWVAWLKSSSISPNLHHLGTTAMLPKSMGGVVDNDFKVYGTKNVRVVDLGVLPFQVAGHSMAVLYGVAEWASEKIKSTQSVT
ncbi:GMC oxidoreductase-domain-containing protein [Xylariaceae sp. FL1019]|nr:GMC oxidoreductase-domain-containing protein [Xylariaceae sp. FL1019]